MKRILITGVSSGIGEALARLYLNKGYQVYGISRRTPYLIIDNPLFTFIPFDLSRLDDYDELLEAGLARLLEEGIDMLFLNAGISGRVPNRAEEFTIRELQHVISVNVLANKLLLDLVISSAHLPNQCIVSASMAGVRYREGTLPYSLSKAALMAMSGVYAKENPGIFFAVLGLCNVNSDLSRQVSFSERTSHFKELKKLQERAVTENYMVSPEQRAKDIDKVVKSPSEYGVTSGDFIDIRSVLIDK
ncbi:SDR family NAD(P)-dependent oxidoreductase [Oceanospirillum maris]|uniref:SDR family NAD(P)-dependent oxidoreductase n=1 Tax=Oceanospirillum maris TaxID=64977 RepID=UPI000429732B|nr:SDR family oxidoreductase [Oceanospirillum maris]